MYFILAIALAAWAFFRPPLAPVGSTPFAQLTFDMLFGNLWTGVLWVGAVISALASLSQDDLWLLNDNQNSHVLPQIRLRPKRWGFSQSLGK